MPGVIIVTSLSVVIMKMPDFLGHLTVHYMDVVSVMAAEHEESVSVNAEPSVDFTLHWGDLAKIFVSVIFSASMTVRLCKIWNSILPQFQSVTVFRFRLL